EEVAFDGSESDFAGGFMAVNESLCATGTVIGKIAIQAIRKEQHMRLRFCTCTGLLNFRSKTCGFPVRLPWAQAEEKRREHQPDHGTTPNKVPGIDALYAQGIERKQRRCSENNQTYN